MVVCKFFLQGNCRFGQNCRNEHPGNNGSGGQNQNRFGALGGNNAGPSRAGPPQVSATEASIIARDAPVDLDPQKSRPKWIFSSYGPTKTAAVSLMDENEYSAEEIRLRYYQAAARGQDAQADQEATQMYNKINQDYQNILNNVNNIPKFLEDGEKKRPNRHDFANVSLFNGRKTRDQFIQQFSSGGGSGFAGISTTAFGSGAGQSGGFAAGGGGFGQNQNAAANPFGKPPTSTFGQPAGPSAFGSKPAFGQAGFGGNAPAAAPAFGQAAPAFGQSAFGKPPMGAAPGQPAFGASGFGQGAPKSPFAPAAASNAFGQAALAFGQPAQPGTAFGQPPQKATAFGQPAPTGGAFGQPSQPTSGFGQAPQAGSAFGQPSQPTSTFGQPQQPSSGFGQPPQTASAFGRPSQPNNPFGQGNQGSAFGKPAFGQSAQPNSIFGQQAQPGAGISTAFGQPAAPSNGFGQHAGAGKTNDQDMDSEPTQRANPFGARPPSAGGFGTQQPPQPQPPPPAAQPAAPNNAPASDWNPANPLLGKPAVALHVTEKLPPQPPDFDMGGHLTSFRGQRVTYVQPPAVEKTVLPQEYQDILPADLEPFPCYVRPDTRQPEKIWFPKGANERLVSSLSVEGKRLDFEGRPEEYTDQVKDAYRHLYETGLWKDGQLPLVPPNREMVVYDF